MDTVWRPTLQMLITSCHSFACKKMIWKKFCQNSVEGVSFHQGSCTWLCMKDHENVYKNIVVVELHFRLFLNALSGLIHYFVLYISGKRRKVKIRTRKF